MAISPISLATIAAGAGGYVLRGTTAAFETGRSAASIGDINQDGFIDVIIGAPLAYQDPTELAAGGLAYVIYGAATAPSSPGSLATIASLTGGFLVQGEFSSSQANLDNAGFAVAGGGDINGDGLVDYVITAPNADGALDANANAGTIYVIFGQLGGPATVHLSDVLNGTGGFAIHGASAADLAGSAIAVGDTNGDGIADLLIGAEGLNVNTGISYVVFGKATPFAAELNLADIAAGTGGFAMGGEDQTDRAGSATAILDLNGDGIGDYVTGARSADGDGNADASAGDIYVRFGQTGTSPSTGNLASVSDVIIRGHDGGLGAGTTLAAAGDLNGDGFADLAIGSPYASPIGGNGNAGVIYVVFGGSIITGTLVNILAGNGGFTIRGDADLDVAGASLASAGDVNGDGVDDLLIGAPGALTNMAGKTYVLFGRADGFTNPVNLADIAAGTGGFVITGEEAGDNSGSAVAAGDMNGDGFSDLLIGARSADGVSYAQFAAGDAYIVYGDDFSGAVTHPGDNQENIIDGDSGANTMVAGQGNDILTGNGGADVMYGGEGEDQFSITDATFRRIDGGTGFDSLQFDATGSTLSLADIVGSRLRSVEEVKFYGTGANTLTLTARAVLNISEQTNTLVVEAGGDDTLVLQDSGWSVGSGPEGYSTYVNGLATLQVSQQIGNIVPCFATGTHIATARGEVRVEELREGDIAVLADGMRRPIRWIGHRATRIATHPRPHDVQPIRIRADAFGPGRPYRDLRLSPDHAVYAHGALVPVRHLVNGATIAQEHVGEITYWHVELAAEDGTAAHDVLLAEGLPCESFLDTGNRGAFANGGPATHLHPDFALRIWDTEACAPLLRDGAPLADLRTELLAEATALGWDITPDPDLRLLVDGRPVWPQLEGGRYLVRLPAGARTARLRSRRTVPTWLRADTDDRRTLGVAVTRLAVDGAPIALDNPRLASGWHAAEGDLRWTDGDAALPVAGGRVLELAIAPLERYWRAPGRRLARHTA